jgi:hypothetical protein
MLTSKSIYNIWMMFIIVTILLSSDMSNVPMGPAYDDGLGEYSTMWPTQVIIRYDVHNNNDNDDRFGYYPREP